MTIVDIKRKVIHRPSALTESSWALGPYKLETLVAESEEDAATAYRVRIEPNQQTATSFHKIAEEFYFVLSGSATAILDGSSYAVKPGDFLRLPPGTTHAFVTSDEPLEMLDIHIPGCRPERDTYFVEEGPSARS